jgi:hypothetical protein
MLHRFGGGGGAGRRLSNEDPDGGGDLEPTTTQSCGDTPKTTAAAGGGKRGARNRISKYLAMKRQSPAGIQQSSTTILATGPGGAMEVVTVDRAELDSIDERLSTSSQQDFADDGAGLEEAEGEERERDDRQQQQEDLLLLSPGPSAAAAMESSIVGTLFEEDEASSSRREAARLRHLRQRQYSMPATFGDDQQRRQADEQIMSLFYLKFRQYSNLNILFYLILIQ